MNPDIYQVILDPVLLLVIIPVYIFTLILERIWGGEFTNLFNSLARTILFGCIVISVFFELLPKNIFSAVLVIVISIPFSIIMSFAVVMGFFVTYGAELEENNGKVIRENIRILNKQPSISYGFVELIISLSFTVVIWHYTPIFYIGKNSFFLKFILLLFLTSLVWILSTILVTVTIRYSSPESRSHFPTVVASCIMAIIFMPLMGLLIWGLSLFGIQLIPPALYFKNFASLLTFIGTFCFVYMHLNALKNIIETQLEVYK